jgi:hypothetical protein
MRNNGLWLFSNILPKELIWVIDTYLENPRKKKESPSLQKQLKKIQTIHIRNLPSMYMRTLEDFFLD